MTTFKAIFTFNDGNDDKDITITKSLPDSLTLAEAEDELMEKAYEQLEGDYWEFVNSDIEEI